MMCYKWHAYEDGIVSSICKLGDQSSWKFAEPCASSQSWVVFSSVIHSIKHLFLYSPFTNEVIRFPELKTGFLLYIIIHISIYRLFSFSLSLYIVNISDMASFSLNPSSPDCTIITFFIGDVAYANEYFCCMFLFGKQEWEVLWDTYLFLVAAFNGDILLSCCRLVSSPCGFRRFDLSEKKRVLVGDEMMERQVIFRGYKNYFYDNFTIPRSVSFNCNDAPGPPKDYEWTVEYDLRMVWIQPPLQRIWRASDVLQSGA
ncbi:hypothetical protein ACOSQ2_013065 [Xanthoceras sorbifolium]